MIEETVPMSKIRSAGGLGKWLMQEATKPEKPVMPAMSAEHGRKPADDAGEKCSAMKQATTKEGAA